MLANKYIHQDTLTSPNGNKTANSEILHAFENITISMESLKSLAGIQNVFTPKSFLIFKFAYFVLTQ